MFHLKAKNVFGKISEPCTYHFTVLPPWYRTWWAYLIYVIALGLIVYVLILLNSRRLKAANTRLQNIIQEKTSEIAGQRDELQDQNNDILNSINFS